MDIELQATCSALGYLEGNKYTKEPDCLETVKDLIRFLRRDNDTCDIRRQLGHAQIVQSDLISLVKFYHTERALFETVIKLLVNLTQPMPACFNNEIPDEKTLRHNCLEVEGYLQDYKEAFIDEDFFSVIAEKVLSILKLDWDKRREDDKLQLERLFVLIRNILMIPPDPQREQRTDDDASIHDQVLWTLHTSGIEDLILFVASSDDGKGMLCMHIMEIISLMFREQEAESLAVAGLQRSVTEKEKDQKELEQARAKERAQRKTNIQKFSARHSRFGGTFVMKNTKSISDNDVIYHKPLCEVKSFTYDDGKVPKKIGRNRAPIKTEHPKRRSTLSMRLSLKEFCVQFLVEAYNPLMRSVKHALTRKTTQDNDETYYLWAMRFFMEFCRLHCKRVDLVSETMSMSAFHYIYTQLTTYYENLRLGKGEECKLWGRRSHLALKAYQELLRTLDFMSRSDETQIRESAKVIQSNVFYMIEYRDIFITLLKNFKESKCSRAYLQDLVESAHIFLKMLEVFTKSNKHVVVQKNKKGKRKKKKSNVVQGSEHPEPAPEELEGLWAEISSDVSAVLEGRQEVPEGLTPFDAASEMDMEQQRVEAMLHIQASLRERNPGEAVALFRAAREVWPERDEFGSQGMSTDEELAALQEVCMAALPRPQSQRQEEDEGEVADEGNDENEVEEEEMEQTRRCETEFDFKIFISDFAHQDVIKNYGILLSEFASNSDSVNHCVVKMLHRLSHDLGYVGMLFQASVFRSFNSLLSGPYASLPRYKELSKFACYVVRNFAAIANNNKKVYVDLLFWKSKNEALAITGDYDFQKKSKAKVLWTEQQEDELVNLYEKHRDAKHPELDAVDLILGELTSNHTRMQVLRELKKLGLITSARDIRVKGPRAREWTEEEIQVLRDTFDLHKDSDYPIAEIMKTTNSIKSKNAVIAKLLELGVVDDRKCLLKQRRGKGSRRRRREEDEEDSEEGERLFSDIHGRDRRRKRRGSSDDYSSNGNGDSEDDDGDVSLVAQQTAYTVGDHVRRLVETGYSEQVPWIQRGLRNCAEDRQEGIQVPTPIVPLTEENETAMEDEIFLIFLRSLGFSAPATEQELFWRIPAEFSSSDLLTIVDGLELTEYQEAKDAAKIQEVVTRVFPNISSTSAKSRDKKHRKVKKSVKGKKGRGQGKEKKSRKSKGRNVGSGEDEMDAEIEDDPTSSSDEESDRDRNSQERTFVPVIAKGVKDSDTSDSGLDPEIEAKEQEKIWKEKQGKDKSEKVNKEDRKNALKQMIERRNEKHKRKGRKLKRSHNVETSTRKEKRNQEMENTNSEEEEGDDSAPLGLQDTVMEDRRKEIQTMTSKTLDWDLDNVSTQRSANDEGGSKKSEKILNESSESPSYSGRSQKRALDTDSDSDSTRVKQTEVEDKSKTQRPKRGKRIRFLASDSESDDNDGHARKIGCSDKENMSLDDDDDGGNHSQTQQDESFKLHFGSSDEEDDRAEKDDNGLKNSGLVADNGQNSQSQLGESLRLRLSDSGGDDDREGEESGKSELIAAGSQEKHWEETTKERTATDSFPATLLTQMQDSENDDHISLRKIMKKRKAVVDDSEED